MPGYTSATTGITYQHPPTIEQAKAAGAHLYTDEGGHCPSCNRDNPVRHVVDGTCHRCLVEGYDDGTTRTPGYNEQLLTLDTEEHTLLPRACKNGGHLVKRLKGSTDCVTCAEVKAANPSPRQIALRAGEKWYTPGKPCPHCGQTAPKRVHDGRCQGCVPPRESVMANTLPDDTVMDKETARALGFKVYRTGDYCRRGHDGFRYVSTGQCIECLRHRRMRQP